MASVDQTPSYDNAVSEDATRAIMDDIRILNGGLPEQDWANMSGVGKKSYINLQILAGNGIIHVAKYLYDTDARFIFELIQNADDNKYDIADREGQRKFLHFTLHADRMLVESNEDGFSEQDLRAICSTHQSTKRQAGGYVGHKGIGFKSVFKIARRVHVQSGPFSFSLGHQEGVSGLGMVTPSNQPHEVLPETVKTRMALLLANSAGFHLRAQELSEIPKTTLFFLRRLDKIQVGIHPPQEPPSYLEFNYEINEQMSDTFHNLPQHPSRPNQSTVDVTLAFPVDLLLKPLLESQYVYSFLPMRCEGFEFLIQSNFITQASRQGVHQCERNIAIREELSVLFVKAIKGFCERGDSLRFDWIQYLPKGPIHDPFWSAFQESIFTNLRANEILFTQKGRLTYPHCLQYLSGRHCDKNGQPLLDDLAVKIYLSSAYGCAKNKIILRRLGVTNLSFDTVLGRLGPYLQGPVPRFIQHELGDDWHKRVADLLLRAIETHPRKLGERIKQMNLIPSSHGELLSATMSTIFFPDDTQGRRIPDDLGVALASRTSVHNETRRKLFQLLGRYNRPENVVLESSIAHLEYMFFSSDETVQLDSRIYILDKDLTPVYRAFVPYGKDILQSSHPDAVHIIHEAYLNAVPTEHMRIGLLWLEWLENAALVQHIPRFVHRRTGGMSDLFRKIAKHDPMTFLGLLSTHHIVYMEKLTSKVIDEVKKLEVPCVGGDCHRAGADDQFDLFLDIPDDWPTVGTTDWDFLGQFGVGITATTMFFVDIFSALEDLEPQDAVQGAMEMYEELHKQFEKDQDKLKYVKTS
ncbi:unnamed protein product [Penicillium nalgiovense]|nr:unnamed protein product [Penicillium nalgiovense]